MHGLPVKAHPQNASPQVQVTSNAKMRKHGSQLSGEIVPDSEEDRRNTFVSTEVIEISSDEETLDDSGDNFLPVSGFWPTSQKCKSSDEDAVIVKRTPQHGSNLIATPRKLYRAPRRVIESSDSESNDAKGLACASEVIELSDSSPERPNIHRTTPKRRNILAKPPPVQSENELSENEGVTGHDEAILILDEPRSSRKPIQLSVPGGNTSLAPLKQLQDIIRTETKFSTSQSSYAIPASTHVRQKSNAPSSTKPSGASSKPSGGTPRVSKKAYAAAEQQRRALYAQRLFEELNHSVFDDKLPKETKLNWSKRLLTTAGRAKWHRSRDGVQTTEIELAEKILDCDARIRNTLSHEMCHLASWIIDGNPKEVHGRLFKAWSDKVMRRRPEIQITTRHDYEIGFKFNWKCLQCAKVYGRHSRSIDVTKVVCGACREGRLVALFETRASRTPKTPKTSKQAAVKAQDSPQRLPSLLDHVPALPSPNTPSVPTVYALHDSDPELDSDIEKLTTSIDLLRFTF